MLHSFKGTSLPSFAMRRALNGIFDIAASATRNLSIAGALFSGSGPYVPQ
jgi:hypothetical protein